MTTYSIERNDNGYRLKHIDGPFKCGLEKIPPDAHSWLDEAALVKALITLRVPGVKRAIAIDELRIQPGLGYV